MSRPLNTSPLVAINAEFKQAQRGVPAVTYLFTSYCDAIVESGAIPIVLPPYSNPAYASQILSMCVGVVMVGGGDLDPRNDGYMLHPYVRPMHPRRESFDRQLIAEVAKRRLPFLGVGVGMQLLNVSQGGTLFLHIPDDIPRAMPHRDQMDVYHRHALTVEKGTLLDEVYGDNEIRVNSSHHMAVDDVAPDFLVSARCPGDGVVEAIESTRDDWFALGVQFHPESLSATALDRRIFAEFVKGAVAFEETGRNQLVWTPERAEASERASAKRSRRRETAFDLND